MYKWYVGCPLEIKEKRGLLIVRLSSYYKRRELTIPISEIKKMNNDSFDLKPSTPVFVDEHLINVVKVLINQAGYLREQIQKRPFPVNKQRRKCVKNSSERPTIHIMYYSHSSFNSRRKERSIIARRVSKQHKPLSTPTEADKLSRIKPIK